MNRNACKVVDLFIQVKSLSKSVYSVGYDAIPPAWPLPGKSVNMLVREISEKGAKLLQIPKTEKPEKGGIFQYIWKSRKRVALKCCSSNQINGYFLEKRVGQYQTYQRKGGSFLYLSSQRKGSLQNIPGHAYLHF